jgi:hypothetical protein
MLSKRLLGSAGSSVRFTPLSRTHNLTLRSPSLRLAHHSPHPRRDGPQPRQHLRMDITRDINGLPRPQRNLRRADAAERLRSGTHATTTEHWVFTGVPPALQRLQCHAAASTAVCAARRTGLSLSLRVCRLIVFIRGINWYKSCLTQTSPWTLM